MAHQIYESTTTTYSKYPAGSELTFHYVSLYLELFPALSNCRMQSQCLEHLKSQKRSGSDTRALFGPCILRKTTAPRKFPRFCGTNMDLQHRRFPRTPHATLHQIQHIQGGIRSFVGLPDGSSKSTRLRRNGYIRAHRYKGEKSRTGKRLKLF
jgi:hypothetical protein